jgi:hypothetical protein
MHQPLLVCCVFIVDETVDPAPDKTVFLFTMDKLGRTIDCARGVLLAIGPSPALEATFGLAVVIGTDMDAMPEVAGTVLRSGST